MYKMIAEYRTGRSNRKTQMSFLYRFLLKTAVIAGIAVICFAFVLQIYRATGNTMSPFVRDGDLCVFYKLDKEYLNEVVLYHAEDEKLKIGRITGVGGQTIEFQEDGGYTVDGYEPTEEIPYETYAADSSKKQESFTLSEDEFFILNDFRALTDDSREYGAVRKSDIEGKLLFMLRRRNF